MRIVWHVLILAFAVGLTLVTFNFWGDFGVAMKDFLDAPSPPPPPASQPFMVNALPPAPAAKPPCPKGRKCQ